jgi:hypothetical protein
MITIYKKFKEEPKPSITEAGKSASEPTVLVDIVVEARGGAQTLKPALRRIYMTRSMTYTSAVKNYVETYQEGLKDVLDEKAARTKSQRSHQWCRYHRRHHRRHRLVSKTLVSLIRQC